MCLPFCLVLEAWLASTADTILAPVIWPHFAQNNPGIRTSVVTSESFSTSSHPSAAGRSGSVSLDDDQTEAVSP